MDVTLFLNIIWIIYGIAGLLGYQNIPKKYKGYSWTVQYKQFSIVYSIYQEKKFSKVLTAEQIEVKDAVNE